MTSAFRMSKSLRHKAAATLVLAVGATVALGSSPALAFSGRSQTISFTSTVPTSPAIGATYLPTASATSGLTVTFRIDGSVPVNGCSYSSTTGLVTFGVGACVIDANQSGGSGYNAAPQMTQTVTAASLAAGSVILDTPAGDIAEPPAGAFGDVTAVSGLGVAVDGQGDVSAAYGQQYLAHGATAVSTFSNGTAPAPKSIAADNAGDVVFSDLAGHVYKTVGGTTTLLAGGFSSGPLSEAISKDGQTVYIADSVSDRVYSIPLSVSNGTPTRVTITGATIDDPEGVAVDGAGDLFVSSNNMNRVYEVPPGGGAISRTLTVTDPTGLATDAAGNLYVASTGSTSLYRFAPSASTGTVLSTYSDGNDVAVFTLAPSFTGTSGATTSATVGASYSYQYAGTDPNAGATLSFALGSGSLPPGMTLTAAGLLAGTPTTAGSYTFTVNAYDGANVVDGSSTTIVVAKGTQGLAFTSTAPTAATVGSTYPVTVAGGNTSSAPVLSIDSSTSASCTINGSGTVTFNHVGTCEVDAFQAGNSNYNDATVMQQVSIGQAGQALSFTTTAPTSAMVGGTYTPAATGGNSGSVVTFSIDSTVTGVCSITGGVVSFNHVGSCTVDADQAGTTDYKAAATLQQKFTVAKGSGSVSFGGSAPTDPTVGGSYTPSATAGPSSGATSITVDATTAATCSIDSNGLVSFNHAGSCVIDADQAGDADYTAAATVQQTLTIGQASQSLAFTSVNPDDAIVGGSYTPTATPGGSSASVVFSIDESSDSGVCSLTDGVVSFLHAGSCVIDANQAGDADYTAAPQIDQDVTIGRAAGSVSFSSDKPTDAVVDGSYDATANPGPSSSAPTFSIDPSSTDGACTVDADGTVSFAHVGTCVVDLDQAGDSDYTAATTAQQAFLIGQASGTVSFSSIEPTDATVGGVYTTSTTPGGSSEPVIVSIDDSSDAGVCTVDGAGAVSFAHVGTCIIDANQAGDADYTDATQAQQTVEVAKAGQAVAFTSVEPTEAAVGGSYTPTTSSGDSGSAVALTVDASSDPGVCSISDGVVSYDHVGNCVIDANQAGDADYTDSEQAQQSFTVGQGAQSLVFTSVRPTDAAVGGSYTPTGSSDGSDAPVTFSVDASSDPGACTIGQDGTVSFDHVGTCNIDADQAGDADYAAATTVSQTISIAKAAAGTITFTSTPPVNPLLSSTYTPMTDGGGSSQPVTMTVGKDTTNDACSITDGVVTFNHAGLCEIVYSQAGDDDHDAAMTTTESVAVPAVDTTTTLTVHPGSLTAEVDSTFPTTGTPTGNVTFYAGGNKIGKADLVDGVATFTSAGLVEGDTFSAVYGGSNDYTTSSDSTARVNPVITAKVTSTSTKTRYGWYSSPVTITFTCTPGSAPLVSGACPSPIVLSKNTAGYSVTRTIFATDGGVGSVSVRGINIDHTPPRIYAHGVRDGAVYRGAAPVLTCVGYDPKSGVVSCTKQSKTVNGVTTYSVTATNRSGLSATTGGTYYLAGSSIENVPFRNGAYVTQIGNTYTLRVISQQRPRFYSATPADGANPKPTQAGALLTAAGKNIWTLQIHITPKFRTHPRWNIGVNGDGALQVLTLRVRH